MTSDPNRVFLRHVVATLAYRCEKTLRGAPPTFATWRPAESTRTPVEILAHIGDLLDWVLWLAREKSVWHNATPQAWADEKARFFAALRALDHYLASDAPLATPWEKLFQGGLADALTHTGQLAMLRRMHGAPMKSESYARADIAVGRVGAEQVPAKPENEFD